MRFTLLERMTLTNCFAVLFLVVLSLILSTSQQTFAKTAQSCPNGVGGGRQWTGPNGEKAASNKCWTGFNNNDFFGQGVTISTISVKLLKAQSRGYQTVSSGILPGCDKSSGWASGYLRVEANSPTTSVITCGGLNHNYWVVSQHFLGTLGVFSYNP